MGARILIVDAEPTVRTLVKKILEKAGHDVRVAGDLPSALKAIEIGLPDLVLTNVYLPGVTGHDAIRSLKEAAPATPILMISGLPDHETIDRWKDEDGWDVFPKPFAPEALVRKVAAVIDGSAKSAAR
ncbi:MAG: response regulator [Acidobacteriota bacterium]|nr:response regulator [Acidobacteriota bacterium]